MEDFLDLGVVKNGRLRLFLSLFEITALLDFGISFRLGGSYRLRYGEFWRDL